MNTDSIRDPNFLSQQLDTLTKMPAWETKGVTYNRLKELFDNNQSIFHQTFEKNTAKKLSNSLNELADRVKKEFGETKEGADLANNIKFYAKAVFNENVTPAKLTMEDLPADSREEILSKVLSPETPAMEFFQTGIRSMPTVAKAYVDPSNKAFAEWYRKQDPLPLLNKFFKTGTKVVDFIIKNNITKANLSGIDISEDDYERLAKNSKLTDLELGPIIPKLLFQKFPQLQNLTFRNVKDFDVYPITNELDNLTSLEFKNCNFKGVVFGDAIGHCKSLQSLIIRGNITPESEQSCILNILHNPNLKRLHFPFLSLQEQLIVNIITNKPNLESLSIKEMKDPNNQLPNIVKQLSHLKHIDIRSFRDTNELLFLDILRNVPKLESIVFDTFKFSNEILTYTGKYDSNIEILVNILENFPKIKGLKLQGLQNECFTESLANAINKLTNIENLDIEVRDYRKTPEDWVKKAFSGLSGLKNVNLEMKQLGDSTSSEFWSALFEKNPQLTLTIDKSKFNIAEQNVIINSDSTNDIKLIASIIRAIPQLKTVHLKKFPEDKQNLLAASIKKHTEIDTISIGSNMYVDAKWLSTALSEHTGLRNLSVRKVTSEAEEDLAKVVRNNQQLESLFVTTEYSSFEGENFSKDLSKAFENHDKLVDLHFPLGNTNSYDQLLRILESLPQLQSLNISNFSPPNNQYDWDPVNMEEVISKLTELRSLNLSRTRNIPETMLNFLLHKLPVSLENLNLANKVYSTGENLLKGLAKHQRLQSLNLKGCTQVKLDVLKKIIDMLPYLTKLNLTDCDQFSKNDIQELKTLYPNLRIQFEV